MKPRLLYGKLLVSLLFYQHLLDLGKSSSTYDDDRDGANQSLRMGELEPWIDENFVRTVWFNLGEQVNVKMIRDKFSG